MYTGSNTEEVYYSLMIFALYSDEKIRRIANAFYYYLCRSLEVAIFLQLK